MEIPVSADCPPAIDDRNASRYDFVHRNLKKLFSRYGRLVGRRPVPFIVTPIIVSALLGIGLIRIETNSDIEHLFTPSNGAAKDERKLVETLFPMNDSIEFSSTRLSTLGTYGRVIVEPRLAVDVGGMNSPKIVDEILKLNEFIQTKVTATNGNVTSFFSDLCTRKEANVTTSDENVTSASGFDDLYAKEETILARCNSDPLIELLIENRTKYETLDFLFPVTESNLFLGRSVSAELTSQRRVASVSALSMTYWLRDTHLSRYWEEEFVEKINSYRSDLICVRPFTSNSLGDELAANVESIFVSFVIAFTLLITFACTSLVMIDWVRTKPMVGMLGVLSPALAILASFGLLALAGVQFSNVVRTVPFLVLGIGVDDMFILIEGYRHTSPRQSVPERMADTLADAGMSITITSITDFIAFGIGGITVFPAVFDFCIYAAVAVLFDYIFQITFFAGWMALDARREEANRHAATFQVVLPKKCSEDKSRAYRIFCSGGVRKDGEIVDDEEEHLASRIVRDWYGKFVVNKAVKVVVLILFCGYLGASIYGMTRINQGLELKNLVQDDSYAHDFLTLEDRYFDSYGPQVQFVIGRPLEYWNASVRKDLDDVVERVLATEYASPPYLVISWLKDFETFVLSLWGLENSTIPKHVFMPLLRQTFLTEPTFEDYKLDINFSDDQQEISSSRLFVQTNNLIDADLERKMTVKWRRIAEEESMTAYHPAFVFFDQYIAILPNTLQNVGIALAAMFVVSIFIIPHPWAAFLITASIVTICVGVAGLMAFWSVNLDSISMINIILCIGFSVDFSAHICYAFMASKKATRNEKTVDALYQLGYPIIQGAISTILGTIPLAFSSSYLFRTFFKTLFLVICLGFLHGFVILPVVLSLIGPMRKPAIKNGKTKEFKMLDVKPKHVDSSLVFSREPEISDVVNPEPIDSSLVISREADLNPEQADSLSVVATTEKGEESPENVVAQQKDKKSEETEILAC